MNRFEPAHYSLQELAFLKDNVGKPPVVALSTTLPKGVNPTAVRTILTAIYELEQLQEHKGMGWAGCDSIKVSIDRFLETYARDRELTRRGAPKNTSMYMWDGSGRPHRGGTGSDSEFIRTRINDDGRREHLGVDLLGPGVKASVVPWARSAPPLPADLNDNQDTGLMGCPLCGFAVNYDKDSQASRNMARARVGKHCKTIPGHEADQHRALYTALFG